MANAHHAIKAVARRTGLSAHVIRIWEKRYGAVEPCRTDTNRRLYTDEDVERLILLRDITHAGHSIGAVAQLPNQRLHQLAREAEGVNNTHHTDKTKVDPSLLPGSSAAAASLLDKCVAAVKSLNSPALEDASLISARACLPPKSRASPDKSALGL